jgi:hypothetical protein
MEARTFVLWKIEAGRFRLGDLAGLGGLGGLGGLKPAAGGQGGQLKRPLDREHGAERLQPSGQVRRHFSL